MSTKSLCGIFIALTVLMLCGSLRPRFEANATLNSDLNKWYPGIGLKVSYEFNTNMLRQAIGFSSLVVIGIWFRQERSRNPLRNQNKWIQSLLYYGPMLAWATTFLISTLLTFSTLNLVLKRFCKSNIEVLQCFLNLNLLFLQNVCKYAIKPFWDTTTEQNGIAMDYPLYLEENVAA